MSALATATKRDGHRQRGQRRRERLVFKNIARGEVWAEGEEAEGDAAPEEGRRREALAAANGRLQGGDDGRDHGETVPDAEPELVHALRAGHRLADEELDHVVVGGRAQRAGGQQERPKGVGGTAGDPRN